MPKPGEDAVNIGPAQRRVRLVMGAVTLSFTLVTAAYLATIEAGRLWRVALFVPVWTGIHAVLEARTGVCPRQAQCGERDLEALFSYRGRPIEDEALADAIRSRAARISAIALGVGLALTTCYVLIPL